MSRHETLTAGALVALVAVTVAGVPPAVADEERRQMPSISEGAAEGMAAYQRVLDELEVPEDDRVDIETPATTGTVDALEGARRAQEQAIEDSEATE